MTTPCKYPYYITIPSLSLSLFVYNISIIYIYFLYNIIITIIIVIVVIIIHNTYIYISLPTRYPHKTNTETRTSDPQLRNVGSSKRRKWSSTAPGSPCPPSGKPGGWFMGDRRCCGTGTNYRWFINIRWLY
jgi:hypothetical protein